jgi:hypothetical protein
MVEKNEIFAIQLLLNAEVRSRSVSKILKEQPGRPFSRPVSHKRLLQFLSVRYGMLKVYFVLERGTLMHLKTAAIPREEFELHFHAPHFRAKIFARC